MKASPPPPMSALVARVRASRMYAAERRARQSWLAVQKRFDAGEQVSPSLISFVTMTLWAAIRTHADAAARYQETLRRREAMPVDARWSIKDIERWLVETANADRTFASGGLTR